MGVRLITVGAARLTLGMAALAFTVSLSSPALAGAQPAPPVEAAVTLDSPRPITPQERRAWIAEGIIAPRSLGTSVLIGTWQTATGWPREWQGPSGFTKRVLTSEADSGISRVIEAGLGQLWGEDPRSTPSRRHGFRTRLGYAMKTVALAPRPDGHFAPAWGRFAGVVGSNVVQNAWLPARLTTPKETAGRIAVGFVGRLATNLWEEFGPDLRRRLARGRSGNMEASRQP